MNRSTKGRNAVSMRMAILFLGLVSCLLSDAQAQTLLTTHGNLLAASDQLVPGPSGASFGTSFDLPVVADDGTVLFLANMYGGDVVIGAANNRALFRGTTAANLSMMVRSSDPAPGLAGLTLFNGSSGIQGNYRLSPDGRTFWSSYLSAPGNADAAIFGGFPGSLAPIVREGDTAPGTNGAVFSGFVLTSSSTRMNRNGAVLFKSKLSGGDVVGVTNDEALFTGTPGALSMVVRKGDTVLPGPVTASDFAFSDPSMNSSGQVLYGLTLGGTATAANNASLWLHTPGSGNTLLVREGQLAPGTAGATFTASFDVWAPTITNNGFNNSGQYVMMATLQGGDVNAGFNDQVLYVGSASGLTKVARKGDPAPGTGVLFGGFNNSTTYINNAGVVLTVTGLMGGTSGAGNQSAVYVATPTGNPGAPYALSLIMRAGDPAPGTQGAFFGPSFSLGGDLVNDSGQAVIKSDIRGGDQKFGINDNGAYAWDPVKGLFLIARQGDQLQVGAGFQTVSNFGYTSASNTDGSALGLSKSGKLAMNVGWFDGGGGPVTLDLNCNPVYYPDADHDGYGDASSTNGVCSNASPPAGSVPNHTDCNDANPNVYNLWYQDTDGDGYGNALVSVCDDATPPAGYVRWGTDCNVTDPTIHPDRTDESCDGVDQNCNNYNDEGYLEHQSYCGVGACASLGVARCELGHVIDTCRPNTVAPPTGTPLVKLSRISGGASLNWTAVSAAEGYDVTRGSLIPLRSTLGNFTTATSNCLGNDLAVTTVNDNEAPTTGQGFWYVLRAVNCGGNASYNDSGSPDQVGLRDAEIAASGVACQ